MDLQPPSILTQLPRPLQTSTGKTQIGEVFSLVESKKRKRHEVVVAVDGEGLNIYNVQYPKLVTSYAVPPQSEFSCLPCSIRLRNKESPAVKRYTYCAVGRPQGQIKGFFEETVPGTASAPVITSVSYTLKGSRSPIIFVGTFPRLPGESNSKDSFDVLVVHQDGTIRRLASDLETERWNIQPPESDHETSAAFLVDFDDARRTLFRRRPDLATLAVGDISTSANDVPPVLLLVSQSSSSQKSTLQAVKVHMFSVTTYAETKGSHELHHLNTVQLPGLDGASHDIKEVQWTFHSGSAGLGLSFRQGFMNYDLSQYPPSCTSSLILKDEDFSSIMRISPHSVIGAGKSLVALYDTHYSSIQRSIALSELQAKSSKTPMKFVGYFAKLGIALAIKENTLQAFDLSSTQTMRGTSVKRQRDGLLINAIGRGVGSSSLDVNDPAVSLGLKTPAEVNQWNAFKKNLEKASKAKNSVSFDNAVESYFGDSLRNLSLISVHSEKISYILSQIFTVRRRESRDTGNGFSALEVIVWPKKTCEWLVNMGQLSIDHIEAAVRRENRPQILPPFESGTLVCALVEIDASLEALTLVLRGPSPLDQGELAQALKIFLNTARTHSVALEQSTTMALTGAADVEMTLDEVSRETENRQAASSSTETSLEDAFIGLNLALSQLHSYPTNQVVSCLRSTLSNTDTLAIVHHLRVSLATGGYTARFTEEPPIPLEAIKAVPPLSLDTIIDLMNASVDAIGPSGWIAAVEFAGTAVNEAEMISHMQSEISAALAGIEEAAYMKGIVGEFIRYGSRLKKATKKSSSSSAANAIDTSKDTDAQYTTAEDGSRIRVNREYDSYGALWETYTFPNAGEEDGKILPLSLNTPESEVSQTKIQRMTGEVSQRTKREMAYLRRQTVPDYSIVKIDL